MRRLIRQDGKVESATHMAVATSSPATQTREELIQDEERNHLADVLQMISANLELQARRVHDPGARAALMTAVGQLEALGELQRALRWPRCQGEAEYQPILLRLCSLLRKLVTEPHGHTLHCMVNEASAALRLPADHSYCLSLLASELILNAAKHGFTAGGPGQITVSLSQTTQHVCCTVSDNGNGQLPELPSHGAYGMLLAGRLAAQVGGHCRWVFNRGGAEVRVELPLPGPAAPVPDRGPAGARRSLLARLQRA